jgi:uncharacterized protein
MKSFATIGFLVISNVFMTLAWYGHLRFKDISGFEKLGLWAVILISWGVALFEYCFQVPANRIGFQGNGGPFSLVEMKMIQEVISISVFVLFTLVFFRTESFRLNHLWGFLCLLGAVYFMFKK